MQSKSIGALIRELETKLHSKKSDFVVERRIMELRAMRRLGMEVVYVDSPHDAVGYGT